MIYLTNDSISKMRNKKKNIAIVKERKKMIIIIVKHDDINDKLIPVSN